MTNDREQEKSAELSFLGKTPTEYFRGINSIHPYTDNFESYTYFRQRVDFSRPFLAWGDEPQFSSQLAREILQAYVEADLPEKEKKELKAVCGEIFFYAYLPNCKNWMTHLEPEGKLTDKRVYSYFCRFIDRFMISSDETLEPSGIQRLLRSKFKEMLNETNKSSVSSTATDSDTAEEVGWKPNEHYKKVSHHYASDWTPVPLAAEQYVYATEKRLDADPRHLLPDSEVQQFSRFALTLNDIIPSFAELQKNEVNVDGLLNVAVTQRDLLTMRCVLDYYLNNYPSVEWSIEDWRVYYDIDKSVLKGNLKTGLRILQKLWKVELSLNGLGRSILSL